MDKIDVVIAWVDGSDHKHLERRQKFQATQVRMHSAAVMETRFREMGEIYYCIASILKNAKFINKIWIISDQQQPKFIEEFAAAGLCSPDFIEVVDHSVVFDGYEDVMPTFSSRSIEAVVWRVPRLAEHFVYLNDDFFFNHPIEASFLFRDGIPNLRGLMSRPSHRRLKRRIVKNLRKLTFQGPSMRPSFRAAQELAANQAGYAENFLLLGHHPHPMRRQVSADFYAENPNILEKQISYRFRDIEQFLPVSVANHLEMKLHNAPVSEPVGVAYIKSSQASDNKAYQRIEQGIVPYGCIQNLNECEADKVAHIRDLMSRKFGKYLPSTIDFTEQKPEPVPA